MKKLLGIIVLGLLWCGNLYAVSQDDIINQHLKNRKLDNIEGIWIHDAGKINGIYKIGSSYVGIIIKSSEMKNGSRDLDLSKGSDSVFYGTAYAKAGSASISIEVLEDRMSYSGNFKGQTWSGTANRIWPSSIQDHNAKFKSKEDIENEQQQNAIMFTIKDKREQCEAIGFKPETDKFADCVLRLVELDVKKQQDQKIASAKSSGNLAVANQLQQMRNDNSSRYLMDLGQQLLKPKQYNSNIYMPQTQRCTIQGFGSFAKMICR